MPFTGIFDDQDGKKSGRSCQGSLENKHIARDELKIKKNYFEQGATVVDSDTG